jgi:simple sugar transport system substrate-binding protein
MSIFRRSLLMGILLLFSSAVILTSTSALAEKKYRIAALSHCSAGHPFWEVVHKGVEDAAALFPDLEVDFICVPPGKSEDPISHLANLESAIAAGYDAIIVTILDETMFDEPIEKAMKKGIAVLGYNVDDPLGAKGNTRMNYIGHDMIDMHYRAAKIETETLELKPGDHVVITNDSPGAGWSELSVLGHKEFCEEYGLDYEIIIGSTEIAEGETIIHSYLSAHRETKSVMAAGWMLGVGAANAIKALGYKPGEVGVIIRDPVEPALERMLDGYVTTIICQCQYQQGSYSVIAAYQYLKYGFPPTDIILPPRFLTGPDDVKIIKTLVEQGYA